MNKKELPIQIETSTKIEELESIFTYSFSRATLVHNRNSLNVGSTKVSLKSL